MRQTHYAALLLVTTAAAELLWLLMPQGVRGEVQTLCRFVEICAWGWALWQSNRPMHPALAGAIVFGVLGLGSSAACNAAWLIAPWPVAPGDEMCTERWGLPLVYLAAAVAGGVAWVVAVGDKPETKE